MNITCNDNVIAVIYDECLLQCYHDYYQNVSSITDA